MYGLNFGHREREREVDCWFFCSGLAGGGRERRDSVQVGWLVGLCNWDSEEQFRQRDASGKS